MDFTIDIRIIQPDATPRSVMSCSAKDLPAIPSIQDELSMLVDGRVIQCIVKSRRFLMDKKMVHIWVEAYR